MLRGAALVSVCHNAGAIASIDPGRGSNQRMDDYLAVMSTWPAKSAPPGLSLLAHAVHIPSTHGLQSGRQYI